MNDAPQGAPGPVSGALAPRMLKGLQADYLEASWPGHNDSGFDPIGDYVLVKMDQCSATTGGGVSLPEEIIDRMNEAAESGVIYAVGDGAFTRYDDGRPWTGRKPQAGERVYVEKYSGIKAMGRDGSLFRVMGYRCVAAGYTKSQEQT